MKVTSVCRLFGHCRQAFYQSKADIGKEAGHERKILAAVREIREEDPRIGGYRLWLMPISLSGRDYVPGRDRFFVILRRKGLMLPRPKPRHTTDSSHRHHKWRNLIKDYMPTSANRLWVADITYIALANGDVCYLHSVTDAYSRMVVGWGLAGTLKASASMQALQMAIGRAVPMPGCEILTGLVHHSDRGVQYCCDTYVAMLKKHGIAIPMTGDYKPTDNAMAERFNGILKVEGVYPQKQLPTFEYAQNFIPRFIHFYNYRRPHMSIGYKVPAQAHMEQGMQKKMWKKKICHKKEIEHDEDRVSLQSQTDSPGPACPAGLGCLQKQHSSRDCV